MDAIAITDHGNMFGVLTFYEKCIKEGIKPIIGSEFYLSPLDMEIKDETNKIRYHLILLAKNEKGYRNLLKLSSLSYTRGFYTKPRIDKKSLEKYSSDIICLSACIAGEIPQKILGGDYEGAKDSARWYENVFGKGNFFLEIQRHGLSEEDIVNPALIKMSKELDIPLVATNDAHYVNKGDAEAQDVLMCIGMGKTLSDEDRFKFNNDSYYLKTPEEMNELFFDLEDAIKTSEKIKDLINIKIEFPGPLLPPYSVPKGFKDENDYLIHIANEGLIRRYGEVVNPEYKKRLDYELSVITKMGFSGYYLIVYDYVNWAKKHDVFVGPGRGSGAGSIVAYSIEITDIDPMKYGLLFERFLNPERISMPDFDIDFCAEKRQLVIDYVIDKYGEENVGQICTFGTLKAKMCITDVARVLSIPYGDVKKMKKCIIDDIDLEFDWLLNGHVKEDGSVYAKNEEFISYRELGYEYEKLFEIVPKIEGMVRQVGIHAAGIVIGGKSIDSYVPLYSDNSSDLAATQYDKTQIEDCGLVKMDFLGLQTLTLIRYAVDLIRQKNKDFDINKIDQEDSKTFDLLCSGDSQCVFQFESGGMRSILKMAKPRSISDLAALNALYRPGPMDNIPLFIEGKSNPSKVKYPFEELKELLEETYGVIVYQEQVMKAAQIFAAYSLGKADVLRKIMGKKQKDKLPQAKKEFIEASTKNGKTEKKAEELFALLEPFAGYGFNKSHAVGYAFLAYQTAFLKANYPVEYMAATLIMQTKCGKDPDKLSEYLSITREMGIKILPPDVNKSENLFTVKDGKIIYGLSGIKNVGSACIENIIEERKKGGEYKDFVDFVTRLQEVRSVNQKIIQSLIYGGAFDSFGMPRDVLEYNMRAAMEYSTSNMSHTGESLFSFDCDENKDIFSFKYDLNLPIRWSKNQTLRNEHDALGFYFSGHPLDEYKNVIRRCIRHTLHKLINFNFSQSSLDLILLLDKKSELSTKSGKLMGKLIVSDYTSSREIMVWSREWEQYKNILEEGCVYCMEISSKDEGETITLKSIKNINQITGASLSECRIYLKRECNSEQLKKLRSYLELQSGSLSVAFMIKSTDENYVSKTTKLRIDDDVDIFDEIEKFDAVEYCSVL